MRRASTVKAGQNAAMHNTPSLWSLVSRRLWRDARAGDLRLLIVGVALAVAAVTAVAFLGDRLDRGLQRDAAALIGGDLVLLTDQPIPASVRAEAEASGLQHGRTVNFPSMVRADDAHGGASRLAALKAVDQHYPLRGELTLREGERARSPAPGTVWVDPAVLDSLSLAMGDTLWVGEAPLRIAGVIDNEPDRGAGFLAFAPRVMFHLDDLARTQLVQPASRVSYRLALAGTPEQRGVVQALGERWKAEIESGRLRGARVENLEGGRPELSQTLSRGQRFLSLVALLAAVLSAVAVALAARDFAQRHLDECAMLRVLGLSRARVAAAYALEFLLVGLGATLLGLLGGLAVQALLLQLLQGLVSADLPPPGAMPVALGLGLGLCLLVAFGLPPVLRLAGVPPLRVLRRDLGEVAGGAWWVALLGLGGFASLLMLVAGDLKLGGITLLGFAVAAAVLSGVAWFALWALRRTVGRHAPVWLRLAVQQLASRPGAAVAQVAALGTGLLALVILVMVRTDLLDSWRAATPERGPDRFVINLLPEQGEPFRATLAAAGVQPMDWHPMFRGRLVAINDEAVAGRRFATERAQRLTDREFNLSHTNTLPSHNQTVGGAWRQEGLSVEEGLARELGLKLGDRLAFDVAGQRVEAPITHLRHVDWSSMRVNFFVIFQQAEMAVPSTWIATYRAPPDASLDRRLSAQFPNLTLVDVSAQIAQVQRVLGQVADAVQLLFGFTLAAGVVVLVSSVTASREVRQRETALMRAMGAERSLLARMQRSELLGLGALAGLLAGGLALGVGALLATQVFEFAWRPQPWVPLGAVVGGALLAWGAGWWGLRGVLRRPVVQTLREASVE
jgi:putative ABC transport system permease protein